MLNKIQIEKIHLNLNFIVTPIQDKGPYEVKVKISDCSHYILS